MAASMSLSRSIAIVEPAALLTAIEKRCREVTRSLYINSGVDLEAKWAADKQYVTVPTGEHLTYFHSKTLPAATLVTLAASIVRADVAVDATTVAIAAALMVRYSEKQTQPISAHMMHRLFVSCVLTAAKVHQDKFPCNKLLGKAVGIGLLEMNRLECGLTNALDWQFVVTQKDLLQATVTLMPPLDASTSCGPAATSSSSSSCSASLVRAARSDLAVAASSSTDDDGWAGRRGAASTSSNLP